MTTGEETGGGWEAEDVIDNVTVEGSFEEMDALEEDFGDIFLLSEDLDKVEDWFVGVTGDNNEEQEMVEVDGFFLMPGEGVVAIIWDWVFGTDTTDFTGVFVTHLGMSSIFFTFSTGLLLLSILFLI